MSEKNSYYEKILNKISGDTHIWFGRFPIVNADVIDFNKGTNYRVSPDLHGKYDNVWLYERPFNAFPQWELILDESLRLLKDGGSLIIRYHDNNIFAVYALKNKLFRSFVNSITLTEQITLSDGQTVSIFKVKKLLPLNLNQNSWTIGVLSNGEKIDNLVKLFDSILNQKNERDIELIVAGPYSQILDKYNVHYVCSEMPDKLARISEKKNAIIEEASNDNLLIIHDRYVLDDGFFKGFDSWGYDFEFVTVKQAYEDGTYYPSYCGFDEKRNFWTPHKYSKKYDYLSDGAFINGGLMIFKTYIAKKLNFNALLLHREAEDIEISWQYRYNGMTPRINTISSATCIGLNSSYTKDYIEFTHEPKVLLSHFNHNEISTITAEGIIYKIWKKIPSRLKAILKKTGVTNYVKTMFYN